MNQTTIKLKRVAEVGNNAVTSEAGPTKRALGAPQRRMFEEAVGEDVLWMGMMLPSNRHRPPEGAFTEPRVHSPVHESGRKSAAKLPRISEPIICGHVASDASYSNKRSIAQNVMTIKFALTQMSMIQCSRCATSEKCGLIT
jgi:hypothetical protein